VAETRGSEPSTPVEFSDELKAVIAKLGEPSRGAPDTRERIAKAIWDGEIAEDERKGNHKDWAPWPADSAIQPYCQSTYRLADAVLTVIESERTALLEALKRLTERVKVVIGWPADEDLGVEFAEELAEAEAVIRKAEG